MPNPILNPEHAEHHIPASWLPWDYGQFRKSDLGFGIFALVLCIIVALINVPKIVKTLPQRTVLVPIDIAAPEVKPVEKKVVESPKSKVKEDAPEAAKALPRAAAPDKPPLQTVRQAPTAIDARPTKQAAAASNSTALSTNTPVAVSHSTALSPAEIQAAAQKRAQGLVAATGLGTAIGSLTNGTNSNPKTVEGRGLLKGGVEGGRPDVKLGPDGASGNGSAKSGVRFGSATDGDKTGHGVGSLAGRGTDDVSGGKIKGNGTGAAGKGDARGRNHDDVPRIMAQNAGRLESAFKRALDDDPTMQGNFTVHLKVAPDGHVISASIVSSDLNNSALEGKFIAMIKGFRFASGDFDTWEGNYTYNFFQ